MVGRPEKFLNSIGSKMTKTVTFLQPFNSLCFENLPFLLFFAMQKRGEGGGKHGGGWEHRPPSTLAVADRSSINACTPFVLITTDKLREQSKQNTFLSIFSMFTDQKLKKNKETGSVFYYSCII